MSSENQDRRPNIRSELDLALLTTDSVWGRSDINPELRDKIIKEYGSEYPVLDSEGKPVLNIDGSIKTETLVSQEGLWSLLGYYTRDLRLGNLGSFNGEVFYCQYYLDLAGDFLQAKQVSPFLICLSRVATLLELSQSKGGFLRRRMNTFSQEHINMDSEPKKVSLFGKGGNNKSGGM